MGMTVVFPRQKLINLALSDFAKHPLAVFWLFC
jgi:hypothetical protein